MRRCVMGVYLRQSFISSYFSIDFGIKKSPLELLIDEMTTRLVSRDQRPSAVPSLLPAISRFAFMHTCVLEAYSKQLLIKSYFSIVWE